MREARAAVMTAFGGPIEVKQYALPEQLSPGAALVRVTMAGVCGTDVHLWKGQLPIRLPVILGHETIGRIEALGEGLEQDWAGAPLKPGDLITWSSSRSCGACYYCKVKRLPVRCVERKAYGISYPSNEPPFLSGGFAEYIYLRRGTAIFRIPETVSPEQIAGAGCALVTAIHGVERVGIEWGDQVIVQGAGPVGIAATAIALSAGAGRVCVIGGPRRRLEMARRFGADHTIDIGSLGEAQRRAEALEWSGGYGADVVIECVGEPEAVAEGWPLCRDGGRYLVLGHYADAGPTNLNPHLVTRKQLTVYGSWSSEPRHLDAGLRFLGRTRERFPFQDLVSHRFDLHEVTEALRATAAWSTCKSIVSPS